MEPLLRCVCRCVELIGEGNSFDLVSIQIYGKLLSHSVISVLYISDIGKYSPYEKIRKKSPFVASHLMWKFVRGGIYNRWELLDI